MRPKHQKLITDEWLARAAEATIGKGNEELPAAGRPAGARRRPGEAGTLGANLGSHLFSALIACFLAILVAYLIFYAPSCQ